MKGNGKGKLVLVGTPIGNLSDMSPRARDTLAEAPVVMAEDTRRTARFVTERRNLYSYHDHNSPGRIPQIIEFLSNGLDVVLVTDAGMPGISDPAYRAVRAAIKGGFQVEVIPGPSAAVCAVAASGLPTDRFSFEGFLPRKKGARLARLKEMSDYVGSLVYYVGPHHLKKYLDDIKTVLGNRPVCIARELTKLHQELLRGNVDEIAARLSEVSVRGEITVVVGGAGLESDFFD